MTAYQRSNPLIVSAAFIRPLNLLTKDGLRDARMQEVNVSSQKCIYLPQKIGWNR